MQQFVCISNVNDEHLEEEHFKEVTNLPRIQPARLCSLLDELGTNMGTLHFRHNIENY